MKKIIWKFPINTEIQVSNSIRFVLQRKIVIEMPNDAEILTVQTQNKIPYIWALVNPENIKVLRSFEVYGTGHDIPCDMGINRKYINTFQLDNGSLVFHLFECIN